MIDSTISGDATETRVLPLVTHNPPREFLIDESHPQTARLGLPAGQVFVVLTADQSEYLASDEGRENAAGLARQFDCQPSGLAYCCWGQWSMEEHLAGQFEMWLRIKAMDAADPFTTVEG